MQVTAPTELNGCNVSDWWQSGYPAREQFGLLLTESGHHPFNRGINSAPRVPLAPTS